MVKIKQMQYLSYNAKKWLQSNLSYNAKKWLQSLDLIKSNGWYQWCSQQYYWVTI
jgi:hypothetical protein